METLFQPYLFIASLYFGIISGIFLEIYLLIKQTLKSKILTFIFGVIWSLASGILLFITINTINFGVFRLYIVIFYTFGIFLEHKTVGYFIARIMTKIYNFIKSIIKLLQNKLKRKSKQDDSAKT